MADKPPKQGCFSVVEMNKLPCKKTSNESWITFPFPLTVVDMPGFELQQKDIRYRHPAYLYNKVKVASLIFFTIPLEYTDRSSKKFGFGWPIRKAVRKISKLAHPQQDLFHNMMVVLTYNNDYDFKGQDTQYNAEQVVREAFQKEFNLPYGLQRFIKVAIYKVDQYHLEHNFKSGITNLWNNIERDYEFVKTKTYNYSILDDKTLLFLYVWLSIAAFSTVVVVLASYVELSIMLIKKKKA